MKVSTEKTYLRKKSFVTSQKNFPRIYPPIPPKTEKIEVIVAKYKALLGFPRQRAISKTSGGTGKKIDSEKEFKANAT
jgi:hypothetical protein